VYRILITLQGQGLVEFDSGDQVWHIGPQAFVIGSRFLRRTSLVERARPIMRKLMESTGETANLGVEKEGKVLFLNQVETHASIRAFFPPGTLSDMHSSGIGKALLAHMDADRRHRIIKTMSLESYTKFTITDADALNHDLDDIKNRGYSIDNEERNLGMRCIAAPVFDFNREVIAGISVSGPISRVGTENLPEISVAVMHASEALTEAIAGTPPSD
jgi:IclR family acetate operon transcriptional repressor